MRRVERSGARLIQQPYLGGRRVITQRRVRPNRVVMHLPTLDQHLRLVQCVEHLTFQQLVRQLAVEALDVPVLPRASGGDVLGLHAYTLQPVTHRMGCELAAVVTADVARHALYEPKSNVVNRLRDRRQRFFVRYICASIRVLSASWGASRPAYMIPQIHCDTTLIGNK